MRLDNVILVVICGSAVVGAAVVAWRGRRLPIVTARQLEVQPMRVSALDAMRCVACTLSAALIAGVLVVGLGGRLVMRVLAATSGTSAQGLLTEAEERVGEITFGGSLSFVLFVGIVLPLFTAFVFLALRRVLPREAGPAGLVFGVLLLGTFGVDDPLSPDNVDFAILTPRWLAVLLVAMIALLFGVTFAAVAARLDASVPLLFDRESGASFRSKAAYASLVWLVIPLFLVPALTYVGLRTLVHGRIVAQVDRAPYRWAGSVALVALAAVALGFTAQAGAEIL